MNHALRLLLVTGSIAGLATHASSQGQITRGNVDYGFTNLADSTTSPEGDSSFTAHRTANGSVLFQHWWYYRVDNDTFEVAFNNGDTNNDGNNTQGFSELYNGAVAFLTWQDVDERGLMSASWKVRLYSTHPHKGVASSQMTLTNTSAQPIVVNLFNYADFDVCSNQNAVTGTANRHVITNLNCNVTGEYVGVGNDNYEIRLWPQMRDAFLDTFLTDLNNTGLPWPTSDYSAAFQWANRTILPGASETFTVLLAYDESPCDSESSSVNYGTGNAGTNGMPQIFTGRPPIIGSVNPPARVNVSNALPNATGVLNVGLGRTNIPFGNVTLLTNPLASAPLTFNATGNGGAALPIPSDLTLCGVNVNLQALFLDPGAGTPFPVAHTDGLEWKLGGF